MATVKWLHISDWHQNNRGALDRGIVSKALMKDIRNRAEECHPDLAKLDFVIFSGDLAFSGTRSEYDAAENDFLNPLMDAAGVDRSRLFLVPGNHDVDRAKREYLPDLISKFVKRESLLNALLDERVRNHLLFPLQEYAQFVTRFLGRVAPQEPQYGFANCFETSEGKTIGLLGLNSAWMCGQFQDPYLKDYNDYGRLILGEHQFRQYLSTTSGADIRIAFMHHPFHWFGEVEQRSQLENALLEHSHFILRGHEHNAAVSVPMTAAGACATISAGAAYDRRDYPNGYNFMLLDLELGQGTVYLRKYSDKRGQFIKDTDTTGDKTPGQVTFTLPKGLGAMQRESSTESATRRIVGNPWSLQNPSTMEAMSRIYERQHATTPVVYRLVRFVVKANSLSENPTPDEITIILQIQAESSPIYCHKVSLHHAKGSEYRGQARWSVHSEDGSPLEAIQIPIVDPEASTFRQILLFFDPILQPGANSYFVEVDEFVNNSMGDLRKTGRDELYLRATRAAKEINRLDLVLLWPTTFGTLQMRKSSRRNIVAVGEPMPQELLLGALKEIPPGFDAIGWTGSNIPSEGLFAADVVKIDRPDTIKV
jgi:hypothetical protein